MYSLHLSPEQLQIRDTVRDFVAQEIKPLALNPNRLEASARPLLVEALEQASRIGLRTFALSEDAGGAGADNLACCIVTEELAVGDPDVAAVLAQTSILARALFDSLMTPEQRARFLPAFVAEHRYHIALAEHEDGRDSMLGVDYHRPQANEPRFSTAAVRSGEGPGRHSRDPRGCGLEVRSVRDRDRPCHRRRLLRRFVAADVLAGEVGERDAVVPPVDRVPAPAAR